MSAAVTASLLGFCTAFFLVESVTWWFYCRKGRGRRRLEEYFARPEAPAGGGEAGSRPDLRRLFLHLGGLLAPRQYTRMVEKKLAQANLLLRPEEFLGIHLLVVAGGLALGFLLGGGLVSGLALGGMGLLFPLLFLDRAKVKRAEAFNNQIGEALVLMGNSLRAGYGLLQAMEVVGREMTPPISQEFGRILKEINLGVGTEEALQNMAARVKSDDWDLVLTAVLIQRQVGGNLAEILQNIAHTIRERVRIKQEIRTLTAQGRLSGIIISLLPFALAVFLFFSNPDYIMVLFRHPVGLFMLGLGLAAQIIGIILIRRIIRIEV